MKVWIVVGIWNGMIGATKVCEKEEKAREYEKKLFEEYDLPLDEEERRITLQESEEPIEVLCTEVDVE
jgi:ABC-type siderophore export system fused ATPase/permease subunit